MVIVLPYCSCLQRPWLPPSGLWHTLTMHRSVTKARPELGVSCAEKHGVLMLSWRVLSSSLMPYAGGSSGIGPAQCVPQYVCITRIMDPTLKSSQKEPNVAWQPRCSETSGALEDRGTKLFQLPITPEVALPALDHLSHMDAQASSL